MEGKQPVNVLLQTILSATKSARKTHARERMHLVCEYQVAMCRGWKLLALTGSASATSLTFAALYPKSNPSLHGLETANAKWSLRSKKLAALYDAFFCYQCEIRNCSLCSDYLRTQNLIWVPWKLGSIDELTNNVPLPFSRATNVQRGH